MADDWVNTNSTGQTRLAKKDVLAELCVPKPYKVSVKDTATQVFGNSGVLTFTKEHTNTQGDIHLDIYIFLRFAETSASPYFDEHTTCAQS